ncbi:MAG: hypothetical protein PHT88_05580 [Candidatus Moranbacteria bacterium]|nr:hypothetical protein [Candidatus Moranbacteria bacterium]
MKEIITAGDDEEDLCHKTKKVFRKVFALSSLVIIVFLGVMFQQWQGAFGWERAVAHADENTRIGNVCALKRDFAQSVHSESARVSVAIDAACEGEPDESGDANTVHSQLEQEIRAMVFEYPMSAMASAIAKQDRVVAAFLVGIAKKESDWGKHVPTKSGADCYNYWGYKGQGGRGDAMGYACFASPEEAVSVVGGRLSTLALSQHRDTPAKMIVWKCGSSCTGHSPESVSSWIGSVNAYYAKLVTRKEI